MQRQVPEEAVTIQALLVAESPAQWLLNGLDAGIEYA